MDGHFFREISRAASLSFLVGVEATGRDAHHTSLTELDTVAAWVTKTIQEYLLLDDILNGRAVLELEGNRIYGRRPTEAEAEKLQVWLSAERNRG